MAGSVLKAFKKLTHLAEFNCKYYTYFYNNPRRKRLFYSELASEKTGDGKVKVHAKLT
jgi:hypothetical protein